MPLTPAQLPTLKADILANTGTIPAGFPWSGAFVGQQIKDVPNSSDGNVAVAGWYNQAASPSFTLWKKMVPIGEIGSKINGAELAGLTTANHTRLQTVVMLSQGGVNPSVADWRAFFDDIFSGAGGTNTRAALLILWKRLATYVEKLFATGTGSDAVPAITAVNFGNTFVLTASEVNSALNLP